MIDGIATIVVATDSFKGSCDAVSAAEAMARGAAQGFSSPVRTRTIAMADGGEGTLDALVGAWGGRTQRVRTFDALGRPRTGRIGLSPDNTVAVIETAEANGLPLVRDAPLRSLDADSYGVGILIRAALDAGAEELIMTLGGSATSDGGAGMLRGLGARLLDAEGRGILPGARGLGTVAEIDLADLHPRVRDAKWRIASDVTNPLLGDAGAAAVFGPQKGATPVDVAMIDAALARWARLLASEGMGLGTSRALPDLLSERPGTVLGGLGTRPGLGAAGGLAVPAVALFDAELLPGSEVVADAVELDAALMDADLVLTGEGRFDMQSFDGKVVSRVLQGVPDGVPVFVIAGSVDVGLERCRTAGIRAAWSIASGPAVLAEMQDRALLLIEEAAARICATVEAGRVPAR